MVESEGNVQIAADRLKVGALILRKFIERSTRARAVIVEMAAQLADEAQTTLHARFGTADARRSDWAVRFILNCEERAQVGLVRIDPATTRRLHAVR